MNVKGKTVVITGASRGLGQKMAEVLAGREARLALVDLDESDLEKTERLCRDAGGEARVYAVDVSDEGAVEGLFDDVLKDFGSIDGLVNNAGVTKDALLVKGKDGRVESKLSVEDWDAVVNVNLRGVFLCAREAAAKMIEGQHEGVIVNISSISRSGNAGQTSYAASKSGVDAMTLTWARELGRHGIRVAAIAPGFCRTRLVEEMNQKVLEKLRARIPLGRLGDPTEIGNAVAFVFENDFVNGKVLEVDGGLRL